MVIGILGAPLTNKNLGCVALCYSTLTVLEQISSRNNLDLKYIIFDYKLDGRRLDKLCDLLKIPKERIRVSLCGNISDPLRFIKNLPKLCKMYPNIKKCDLLIDMTDGDSFSDIYGDVIFRGRTNIKLLIERMGYPLILGPQTYGPFYKSINRAKAAKSINRAKLVLARDIISTNTVIELGRTDAICTIDIAFALPYLKKELTSSKIKVGINISSMLYSVKNEMKVQRFKLKTDYRKCIETILKTLLEKKVYDIYLIPHVEMDSKTNEALKEKFPEVKCIDFPENPIDIKSTISCMDVFLGARMHATIAAFSTGVPCIPMSYSKKFTGLFHTLNYDHVIDMENNDTDQSVKEVLQLIEHRKELKTEISSGNDIVKKGVEANLNCIEAVVLKYYK